MALNNLEDRLECAIAHINTSVDIDPWAQNLAVESMRMRIALMKGEQPEIIRCKDCKYYRQNDYGDSWCARQKGFDQMPTDFCGRAERRTDGSDSKTGGD